ncbi:glycoside hydrolase family 52 protein [Nibricoccus sp. IMCC34717]|uniref:glycoside hydrolase family 52 protein n=1 Tax=Nibricoccus sp. IMCC34717 TaxID=3034021 RepID=UPI00384D543F
MQPVTPAQESYHTQHSPFGAFASFTIGLVDAPGGFGPGLKGPAKQNVYVGYRTGPKARWQLLPYFTPPKNEAVNFTGEAATAQPPTEFDSIRPGRFTRTLRWATDTWDVEGFRFTLHSPFGPVADPAKLKGKAARDALAPSVLATLEFDNRKGTEDVELIFGIGEAEHPQRPVEDTAESLVGFAGGRTWGFATLPSKAVSARQGFDVFAPKYFDYRRLHVLGGEAALVFRVPRGQKKSFPVALGFYQAGPITTGITASFLYTRHFRDLEDVLTHALENRAATVKLAATRDRELERTKLSADQKFLLAQGTHSYYGSTQLLWDGKRPLWAVNEGEYRMLNTFDLTVDHLFFELQWHPWAVREALDLFHSRYAYKDDIRVSGKLIRGGLSFTHDMGVMNHFTPAGRSSYEVDNIEGCFSHMTMEQLLNWVLCATVYAEKTGDRAWLKRRAAILKACAESMHRRDHPEPAKRDGILKHDSSRVGAHGAEITTYDSLDVSLGQARNNLYLCVKALGAWILLEKAFASLGDKAAAQDSAAAADRLAATLTTKFEADTGFFPAVFEAGNRSRIIPAVEGFAYPLYLGYADATDRKGRFGKLLGQLSTHLKNAFAKGVCIDPESGGWKMSSTSKNTWFSKIALSQYVAHTLFPETLSDEAKAADVVHANWQKTPGCGAFAMCDQIWSDTGITCGSRYYPRGVTAILWKK